MKVVLNSSLRKMLRGNNDIFFEYIRSKITDSKFIDLSDG